VLILVRVVEETEVAIEEEVIEEVEAVEVEEEETKEDRIIV
jgi:hypothetical protein